MRFVIFSFLLISLPCFISSAVAAPEASEPILDDGIGVAGETVLGNPIGKNVVYKFYDTNCGYCRAEYRKLQDLIDGYPELRIVLVQTSILGEASNSAAMSLAGLGPGDYFTIVDQILSGRGRSDGRLVRSYAEKAGIKIGEELDASETRSRTEKLDKNYRVFRGLGGKGVPFFYSPTAFDDEARTSNEFAGPRLGFVEQIACGYSGIGSCESPQVLVNDAVKAHAAGDSSAVIALFQRAVENAKDRDLQDDDLNSICWKGALRGAAETVLPICDHLAAQFPNNVGYVDSYGVAHAALGNSEKAITSLTRFLDARPRLDPVQRSLRESMIEQLTNTGTAIGAETLSQLK